MKNIRSVFYLCLFVSLNFTCANKQLEKQPVIFNAYLEEPFAKLGRGLIALPLKSGLFLSWRKLPEDSKTAIYEIKRQEINTNELVSLTKSVMTNFLDCNVKLGSTYKYTIYPITNDKYNLVNPQTNSHFFQKTVTFNPEQYLDSEKRTFASNDNIITKNNAAAFVFNLGMQYNHAQVATGDLNGDGELEVVIKHTNNWDIDPSVIEPPKDTYKISAFQFNGKHLWTIDLGWGIVPGVFYSPLVIWDIDADGRAEILLKTNKSSDPDDYSGERLTILDGESGAKKNEAPWPSIEGFRNHDYNSNSRNYIAIAHLDGKNPFIITARGLYKDQKIIAYNNKLEKVWERKIDVIDDNTRSLHSLPIADVNDDGKEEILWGERCIGEGGKDLWVIDERIPYNGHPDICFVGDIIPSNEGKEVYYCREGWDKKPDKKIGLYVADNKGKIIWAQWNLTHVDGGWISKITSDFDGMQCYSFDLTGEKIINSQGVDVDKMDQSIWSGNGELLAKPTDLWASFPVDWDGDGIREICLKNGTIKKFDGQVVAKLDSGAIWGADIVGDHREEVIVTPKNEKKVYIYFNTDLLGSIPHVSLLDDRKYKNDLSRTAMQMNVIPLEGTVRTSEILKK